MGRETGSRGDEAAARYVEREFRRMGLEPAGEGGSFFQTVPVVSRAFDLGGARVLAGAEALHLRLDFLPLSARNALPRGRPRVLHDVKVVYGGAWGDTAHALPADFARGRFVVLSAPSALGPRAGLAPFAGIPANLAGAAGIGLVALERLPANFSDFLVQPIMRIEDGRRDSADVAPVLLLSASAAARLLGIDLEHVTLGQLGGSVDVEIPYREGPTERPALNVIAVLRGRDARLAQSYVSISAHHDHVGFNRSPVEHDSLHAFMREYERFRQASPTLVVTESQRAGIRVKMDRHRARRPARPDSIFNGADDDASGTAALLEIAERLAREPRGRRSILFLSHTGEERGLLGSGWFSLHPTVPRDSIVATMDMDMVGRGSARDLAIGRADYLELIGTRRQSTEYGDLIDSLNARRARPFRINYAYDAHDHPEGDWCRADHYSLARFGIPAAAFSTSYHGDYHQVTDEAQYLDYPHLTAIATFVGDVATAVANLDHRVRIDRPKPLDPLARCVQ